MTDQVGVRDAVRQLGRAVGTLVRAVVGVARRRPTTRPVAAGGPPQEWLDLVAETDPAWLAGSRWADRVDPKPTPAREVVEVPPVVEDVPPVAPAEATTTYETAPATAEPRPRRETRALRQPRLVPVEEVAADAEIRPRRAADEPVPDLPERPVADTRPPQPSPLADPPVAKDTPHAETPRSVGDDWPPAPLPTEHPEWTPNTPHDGCSVVHHGLPDAPEVRTEPDHPRQETAPLPAHISELGTWSPREAERRRVTLTTPAAAPTWPDLPRTDDLDDSTAGLAARLWSADAPDALTLAQRRS